MSYIFLLKFLYIIILFICFVILTSIYIFLYIDIIKWKSIFYLWYKIIKTNYWIFSDMSDIIFYTTFSIILIFFLFTISICLTYIFFIQFSIFFIILSIFTAVYVADILNKNSNHINFFICLRNFNNIEEKIIDYAIDIILSFFSWLTIIIWFIILFF